MDRWERTFYQHRLPRLPDRGTQRSEAARGFGTNAGAPLKDGRLSRPDSRKAAKDLNKRKQRKFEQKETKETKEYAEKFPGAVVQRPSQMLRSLVRIVVLEKCAESNDE
jgi:hypothetical protein